MRSDESPGHGAVFRRVRRSKASLFAALVAHVSSLLGGIGLAFLLLAAVGLAMAAPFPMDPASTTPAKMSFSGKMHGISFLIGVPCQILAVLFLSMTLGNAPLLVLGLTAIIWIASA